MSNAARIAEIEAELAALRAEKAAPEPDPEPEPVLSAGVPDGWLEPEPGPSMYDVSQDPRLAIEQALASGHEAGGQAGLGCGVSN
jgi:hypothetical protein